MSEMMQTSARWLSIKQAAEYLGVSPRTMATWISTKKVRASKIGRVVRLDRDDLDQLMQGRKR